MKPPVRSMLYLMCPTKEDYEYVGREKYRQIEERGTGTVETRFKRKDGKIIDVLLSSTPLDPTDLTAGVTFTALDITERKRAEEQIQRDLREKGVLLKEIHHRVKNNLNVITSLLSLQSKRISNKEQALAVFEKTRNRIYSMALVHEQLYKSDDFSKIDMKPYIEVILQKLKKVHYYSVFG